MAVTKIACPRCRAVLKSNQAPPIGKTIKCPGCGSAFPVTADMVQTLPAAVASPLAATPLPATPASPLTATPVAASPALPVVLPADGPRPGSLNGARLGYVLGGVALWLILGAVLGYYCFSANRGTAADKGAPKGGEEAAANKKEKEPEPPLVTPPAEQQGRINDAVNRAVRYLRVTQLPSGTWPSAIGHPIGHAGLPGLTLLECGVPASDPHVQSAANFIREHAHQKGPTAIRQTYELALAILFLDRLGDPKDGELIRTLALRLISGQTPAGGWGYNCPELSADEENQLYEVLESSRYATQGQVEGGTKATDRVRRLPVLQDFKEGNDISPGGGPADNSNTQFATLALWVAGRHKVPLERTTELLLRRFRSQEKNGEWDYRYQQNRNMVNHVSNEPTMTAAGLLGLAVGIGGAKGGGKGDEPGVENGFRVLGQSISEEQGKKTANFYFLWSVERVAVLYQRKKIGDRDWYAWGSGILLPSQKQDGSWDSRPQRFPITPVIDTCFGALFLRQANLAKDLTSKLQRLAAK
jgi:hypothetical protein